MSFFAWPGIQLSHNIKKLLEKYPELACGKSEIIYKAKCKLHGVNSAVRCYRDGRVVAQSRTIDLVGGNDNCGFAQWIEHTTAYWFEISEDTDEDIIFFGEWLGPGVKKGTAAANLPKKIFAVFAAKILDDTDQLIVEPNLLQDLVRSVPDTYVIPWFGEYHVDWSNTESLQLVLDRINSDVDAIEKNDPWIENVFGIRGPEEGLVFYPSYHHSGFRNFANLAFKAKGVKHQTVVSKAFAQTDPNTATNEQQFASMVVTQARLEQGLSAVSSGGFDKKHIGAFISWICADVEKETKDELLASGLEWKQVQKLISDKARTWYIENIIK